MYLSSVLVLLEIGISNEAVNLTRAKNRMKDGQAGAEEALAVGTLKKVQRAT